MITTELENWGRWARDRYHRQHCASIEHRYTRKARLDETPTGWGDWEDSAPPPPPQAPIDVLAAIRVQKVLSRMAVSSALVGSEIGSQYAWALTFRYCYPKYDRWAAARICKVYRPERLLKLITKAERAVANQLQLITQVRYIGGCSTNERISIAQQGIPASRQGRVFLKAA